MDLLSHKIVDEYLRTYKGKPADIALEKSPFKEISSKELAQQLQGLRIAKIKFPSWFANHQLIYPPKINLEQSSSELTAWYKSQLVSGKHLADLTTGMGIDSYWFSKRFDRVDCFELNAELLKLTSHNLKALDCSNIFTHNSDGLKGVAKLEPDWIYVDPSRRDENKSKVFRLSDCQPDMTAQLSLLLKIAPNVMIKTSPMLDISQGLRELKHVREIHVLAVKGEVKELLWLCERDFHGEVGLTASNIIGFDQVERFRSEFGKTYPKPPLNSPLLYLYDPNSALVKADLQDELALELGLAKLNSHTHLYTAPELIDYPGRKFELLEVIPYKKSVLKKKLASDKINVVSKNFPLSVKQIRQTWMLKEGGEEFLFFVKDHQDQKIVIRAKRAN